MMHALAGRVILASGWERRLIAALAGAIGALAMAPIDFFPAVLVPMCVAVWLIDGSTSRVAGSRASHVKATIVSAAGAGWWLGLGYFTAGLWWIGAAFLIEADKFAWAMPLAVVGLPAVLALFTALGFAIAAALWSTNASRVFALAVGLGLGELARAHLLTGFPWNEWGMALGSNLVLAQSASVLGMHGLTLLTILLFALPAVAFEKSASGRPGRGRLLLVAIACFVGLGSFGFWRLSHGAVNSVPGVRLRIVQPNLQQDENFSSDRRDAIVNSYLALSDRATSPGTPGLTGVTHLVWPESAFPFVLSRDPQMLARIGAALPKGSVLLTGAARVQEDDGSKPLSLLRTAHFLNAIQAVSSEGEILGSADKVHLVPFGEYIPFGSVLEKVGLSQFVHIPGGFVPGAGRVSLVVPNLPRIAPVICYEAIFSGEVMPADAEKHRPGLLLNVTNDGWFGMTSGPYQHFAQARLRAIEEGLPLVRAANSGISAIVDPYGRVLESLPLGIADVLDGALPAALPPTFFAAHPAAPFWWLLCAFLLVALAGRSAHPARRRSIA